MLTEAGSTLNGAVSDTATTVQVNDGTKFSAGDCVLIGGTAASPFTGDSPTNRTTELAVVQSVSGNTLTLYPRSPTLQTTGYFFPSKSHASGTRVAPLATMWTGAIEMNVAVGSGGWASPSVDVGHGPETCQSWNARRAQTYYNSLDFDGVFPDTFEWMPTIKISAIDVNRDNVVDSSTQKSTWQTSGRRPERLGAKLRALGPRRSDLDQRLALRPMATARCSRVARTQLGPRDLEAGHPELVAAQVHGLHLRDGQGARRTSRASWDTVASPTRAAWDAELHRSRLAHMRYGLCSTLLHDGFYLYVAGHHGNGIWYDEYDNAGAGRGYLGQPKGAAYAVGTNAWRRDFTGGTALVNPTRARVTVSLGGTFRKIKGTQAPTVNDGSLVTAVTLQPRDGIILLPTTAAGPTPPHRRSRSARRRPARSSRAGQHRRARLGQRRGLARRVPRRRQPCSQRHHLSLRGDLGCLGGHGRHPHHHSDRV